MAPIATTPTTSSSLPPPLKSEHPSNPPTIYTPTNPPPAINPPSLSNPPPPPTLPTIPLPPLLHPTDPATLPTSQTLLTALRTHGFLYLTSIHPFIPPPLLHATYHQSSLFFALPPAQKAACAWTTPRSNRGYTAPGREKTSRALTAEEVARQREGEGADMKESFEIGREGEDGCPNRWPSSPPPSSPTTSSSLPTANDLDPELDLEEAATNTTFNPHTFRQTTLALHALLASLHTHLMRSLALALHLPREHFDRFLRRGDNTLRLLHYPAVARGAFCQGTRVRAGAHTDYGSLTLLFQDQRGGLQVDTERTGQYMDVKPMEATIVVNAGDLLQLWLGGRGVRSCVHRVVEPPATSPSPLPQALTQAEKEEEGEGKGKEGVGKGVGEGEGEEGHPARYSIAYFCNPDFDSWIEPLSGEDGAADREGGVNAGEYLARRLGATY